jgi:predicted porin
MSKTFFLSALLCAAAGTASAQSAITLFGIVDVNVRYVQNDGQPNRKVMGTDGLNSSRLGFRGTEDLGGGLAAGFWLEGGMTPNDGSSAGLSFKRRATVSLVSKRWGELRLGRDYTPSFWTRAWYDPFGENGFGLTSNVDPQTIQPTYIRASNSIGYILPNTLGGFYGQAMVAAGEGSANGKYVGARLGYAKGPLDVSAAVAQQSLNFGANAYKTWVVGAQYNFGVVTLEGAYNHDHVDIGAGTTYKHWLLGAVVPLGLGEIHASYNRTDAGSGNGARALALGYVHNLSKRTALYATAARLDNRGNFKQSIDWIQVSPTPVTVGGRSQGYELGLRHVF